VNNLLLVNPRGEKPIFEQIKDGLRERMLGGVWNPHDRLPSVRELAQMSAINPNTIQKAYRDLEAEGFIYSVAGRGCYAAEPAPGVIEKRQAQLIARLKPLVRELRASGVTADEVKRAVTEGYERTETI
jgi:GntR family transcriptional regulator